MRKITQQASEAFLAMRPFKAGNTRVVVNDACCYAELLLHGNVIARNTGGLISITNAGWRTNTTKERLSGLNGVSIYQTAGVWYLNGKEWNGCWVTV